MTRRPCQSCGSVRHYLREGLCTDCDDTGRINEDERRTNYEPNFMDGD